MGSEHNALKKYFRMKKFVTINLKQILIISEKNVFRKFMETPGNNFTPKNAGFFCISCDFKCSKESDWNRHINTIKHANRHNGNNLKTPGNNFTPKNAELICNCGKVYNSNSGLWKHKKKCGLVKSPDLPITDNNDNTFLTNLVLEVVKNNSEFQHLLMEQTKQNHELQKQMLEVIKNGTNNNNTTNSHNNNKTFNLQFFLNEECKNALNISDFVSSIKMDLDDLEKTGLLGYAEGISNIINKNLNGLDQTMRPIHCSDVKREVFYVKNDDKWIKENDTKPVLTKAIKQVAHENIRQISEWRKKYPDCCDPDSQKNDIYLNIVSNSMSGITSEEQLKNYEKIISNVAKEVIIYK